MAYFIEYGLPPGEVFYSEIALVSKLTGKPIQGGGIDYRLNLMGCRGDYGEVNRFAYTVASTSGGGITNPAVGVIAITIPPSKFFGVSDPNTGVWSGSFYTRRHSLQFSLMAMPADPDFATVLATGTISIGDRPMPFPRITLGVYPLIAVNPTVGNSAGVVAIGGLRRGTWLSAANALYPGTVVDLETAIPANPADPLAEAWSDPFIEPGSSIPVFYKARNSLSDAQIAAIFALGATY